MAHHVISHFVHQVSALKKDGMALDVPEPVLFEGIPPYFSHEINDNSYVKLEHFEIFFRVNYTVSASKCLL